MSQSVYDWFDEPDNVVVRLNPKTLSRMVKNILKSYNGDSQSKRITAFSKESGISTVQIKRWLYGYTNGGLEIKNLRKNL